jgi:hypothetical protein
VQVREVLEGYLDDDQDMKDMNITAKEQHVLQVRGPGAGFVAGVSYGGPGGMACRAEALVTCSTCRRAGSSSNTRSIALQAQRALLSCAGAQARC